MHHRVACRPHPLRSLLVTNEVEQPLQKRQPVISPEPKSGGVRCEALGECAGVVKDGANRICDDLGDRARIIMVVQKVRGDPHLSADLRTGLVENQPQLYLNCPIY